MKAFLQRINLTGAGVFSVLCAVLLAVSVSAVPFKWEDGKLIPRLSKAYADEDGSDDGDTGDDDVSDDADEDSEDDVSDEDSEDDESDEDSEDDESDDGDDDLSDEESEDEDKGV